MDRAADCIYWMTPDSRFFYVHDAACRALGYSREELLSMRVHDIDPDFPAAVWPDTWKKVREEGSFTIESRHRRKDGHLFPVEVRVNYLRFEGKEFNCAIVRDIGERTRAAAELTAAKAFVESVVTNVPEVIYSAQGVDLEVTFVSPRCEVLTGHTVEEFRRDRALWRKIIHPEDTSIADRLLERVRKGLPYEAEYRFIHKDGSTRWVRNSGVPVLDSDGKLARVDGSATDISGRKLAETTLQQSELRYRTLVEHSPYCIHEVDPQGHLVSMNRAGLRMMGLDDESEVRGMPYMQAVADEDRARVQGFLDLAVQQGESSEFEFNAANGQVFQSSFVPILDHQGVLTKIMGITLDITLGGLLVTTLDLK